MWKSCLYFQRAKNHKTHVVSSIKRSDNTEVTEKYNILTHCVDDKGMQRGFGTDFMFRTGDNISGGFNFLWKIFSVFFLGTADGTEIIT